MKSSYDAIVIGAGIVGAACALELACAGMSVAIVERGTVGGGATAAAMGHVVLMDDSEPQFALTSYSQRLWKEIAPALPPTAEYANPGTIWLAADEEEMAEVRRKHEYYRERGIATEVLDEQSLAEAEPNLRRPLAGGLRIISDAVLAPTTAAAFLIAKAVGHGADLMLGKSTVRALQNTVTLESGEILHSAIIVNATGAVSAELSPGIAIRKRKGHLMLTEARPGFVRHQLVELGYLKSAHSSTADSVAFNVQPRRNGQLLVGSSRQFGNEDTGIDAHMIEAMSKRAFLYMPGISLIEIEKAWVGFRAATPDKLPLIGPTEDPSMYLATGHEGLGITTSLATGRLLADHLLGRPTAVSIDPYLPSRLHGS